MATNATPKPTARPSKGPLKWLKTFWHLDWQERLMLVEALLLLGMGRATVLFVPFKRIAPHLGKAKQETPLGAANAGAAPIAHAIYLVSHHTPWDSNCFAQALAGHVMLRRRQMASTLYLGVYKNDMEFSAHAWLRNGDLIVTGRPGHERFTVIARYSWQPPQMQGTIKAES